MKQDAVKSAIQNYIATNRVDATSRDLTRLYATSSTAGACADLRSESVAQVPMRVKSKRTGEVVEDDHPLNAIFSGAYSFQDIMKRSELAMYFWGRNLLQKNRNAFYLTKGLTWVNPNIYQLDSLISGLRGFRVYASSRYQIEPVAYIPLQDAVYMHEVDFDDDYEGVSPIERAFLEASGEVELAQTVLAVFRNMAIPAAIAQPAADSKPSPASKDNLTAMLRRLVQGTINAGRTIVSPDRWEWIQLQNPLKDQSLDIISANARKAVCIASRVPLELIEPSAANYATFEGARRAWANSWLVPRVKWYAAAFTAQIASEYGDEWVVEPDFDDVPFLKEDAAARVNVVTAKLTGTMITIGQARKELGDKVDADPVLDDLYLVQGIPVPKAVLPTLWQYHFAPAQTSPTNGVFSAFSGGLGQTPAISGSNALATLSAPQTPDLRLLERPPETTIPALPAPASTSESASAKHVDAEAVLKELKAWQVIAARERPRDGKGTKWGRDYNFQMTTPGAALIQAYVRLALDDGETVTDVFAVARELVTDGAKAYEDTRQAFIAEMRNIIAQGQASEVSRQKFGGQVRSIVRRYGLRAMRDGMRTVGYDPESFSMEELAAFRSYQEEQSQFISKFASEVFKQGISEAEVAIRADYWANVTLEKARELGILLGKPNQAMMWVLGNTGEHCVDCVRLNGQVHTMKEWIDSGYTPTSGKTECHSFNCLCELRPTDLPKRGNF